MGLTNLISFREAKDLLSLMAFSMRPLSSINLMKGLINLRDAFKIFDCCVFTLQTSINKMKIPGKNEFIFCI